MYVYGSGGQRPDSSWQPPTPSRRARAGWWFWGPFLFGTFFTLGGIAGLAGAAAFPVAGSGLGIAGAVWMLMGIGSLLVAWYAWRDIHAGDPPKGAPVATAPTETPADLDAQLRVTGVPGTAIIKGFKYLAGSGFGGSALVTLNLELSTTLGGTIPLEYQTRVPLGFSDKLAVGASVPVLVSSTDPSKMIIEWTGFTGPPPNVTPPAAAPPPSAAQAPPPAPAAGT